MSRLSALLTLHEGRKNKLYKCTANKWTIGVGHNVEDNGLPNEIIDALLAYDIKAVQRQLKEVPAYLAICENFDFDSPRAAVLVDMCFNMGISKFLKFQKFLSSIVSA